jgi:hypothetical protein
MESSTAVAFSSFLIASALLAYVTRRWTRNRFRYALAVSHTLLVLIVFILAVRCNDALGVLHWLVLADIDFPVSMLTLPLAEVVGKFVKPGLDVYSLFFFGTVGSLQYFLVGMLIDIVWRHRASRS